MAPVAMPNNATISILEKARAGRYGVISMVRNFTKVSVWLTLLRQVVYDWGMANALVQAAEAKRSPIIIQVFPPTMRQQGGAPFLRGLLELARRATVPVSIHVDHAQKAEDITYLLDMAEEGTPLDSIMIDCSHAVRHLWRAIQYR
jgi:fructose-bisphosphate aldolase class II